MIKISDLAVSHQELSTMLDLSELPGVAGSGLPGRWDVAEFLVRCLGASDPRRGHVSHHRLQNSLNIDFTGIHALEHLFSMKFYEK